LFTCGLNKSHANFVDSAIEDIFVDHSTEPEWKIYVGETILGGGRSRSLLKNVRFRGWSLIQTNLPGSETLYFRHFFPVGDMFSDVGLIEPAEISTLTAFQCSLVVMR
jgi:hypothetical protein